MKKTWILGAGASISCSKGKYPTIDSIFSKAKENAIISETTRRVKPKYEDVKNYVYSNFGKNILLKSDKIDIEELLTVLEISRSKKEDNQLNVIYDKIIEIIKELFIQLQFNQGIDSEYKKLVEGLSEKDSVISFNWDLLLDDAFNRTIILNENEDKKDKFKNQYYQFICDYTALRKSMWLGIGLKKPYSDYTNDKGHYLKLHGSIDWYYCDNEKCDNNGKIFPMSNYRKDYYCGECNNLLQTSIIPPVLNKQYERYPTISSMWMTAARELEKSDILLIWGYSLPPTDFYANWLLRQSNKKLEKVIIINPEIIRSKEGEKISFNSIFLRRILGPIRHKVEEIELYEYFTDYLEGNKLEYKI